MKQAPLSSRPDDKKKGRASEIDQLIGARLKEVRKQQRLTQEDLAEKLGVSFQQVQKYENGKNRISFASIYELSNYLNISLEDFMNGVEDNAASGMNDNPQSKLDKIADKNAVTVKETDELLKVYYSLADPKLRKNLLKLVKSMAQNYEDA